MNHKFITKTVSAFSFIALLFLISCGDRLGELTPADSRHVQNEAQTNGFFEDADDMAGMALAADSAPLTGSRDTNGRALPKDRLDSRFACAEVTITLADDNTPQRPHGTITINFGNGCADGRGNTRRGIINMTYRGRRFSPGSTVITTFENYRINDIQLAGTRTVTNTSASSDANPQFTIELADGRATWPDNTFATRTASRTRTWIRADSPLGDYWEVTGTASGTNRDGRTYSMTIIRPLIYKRECANGNRLFMAVEGTKELTVDTRKIFIDYGTGACDRMVTITINGNAHEVDVRGNA